MARDAGVLALMIDTNLRVAAQARGCGGRRRVGSVTARASCVRHRLWRHEGRQERRFRPMTPDANPRPVRDELVRLVATEARIVARRFRPCRLFVARRASLARGRGRRVGLVAIEAILAPFVLGVGEGLLFVTIGAGLRRDRRGLVGMVARLALRRAMGRHGGHERLRFGVATDARRGGSSRGKRVTHQAVGLLLPPLVRVPRFLVVTAQTDTGAGIGKTAGSVVVAILAHDGSFAHVLLVTGARSVLGPRRGYRLRWHARRPMGYDAHQTRDGAREHRHGDRRRPQGSLSRFAHHGPT
jgi:hypothetical protein